MTKEAKKNASEVNMFRPISKLIAEGSLVKDPWNGDWVLTKLSLGSPYDTEQVEFLNRSGQMPCESVYRFKSDVDVDAIAALSYYKGTEWYLGVFQYVNTVLAFSVGNYYYKKLTYEGKDGSIRIGATVEKLATDSVVYSNVNGKRIGRMPKQVADSLKALEAEDITEGCYIL